MISNQQDYLSLVMHNLYAKIVNFLEIYYDFLKYLINEHENLPRRGARFSDLEVISQSLTAEHLSADGYYTSLYMSITSLSL